MGAFYTEFSTTTPELLVTRYPISLSLPFLLLIFIVVVSILLLYLWSLDSAYSLYILDVVYVCLCFGSTLTLG